VVLVVGFAFLNSLERFLLAVWLSGKCKQIEQVARKKTFAYNFMEMLERYNAQL